MLEYELYAVYESSENRFFNKLIKGLWGFIKRWLEGVLACFQGDHRWFVAFFFKLNLFGLDDFFFFPHPFLPALSSGRERNILMKPLLSSYHFDPLVFSPVYTLASRMKGFGFSPPVLKTVACPP